MTGQEAINRALRIVGVLAMGQTPSADKTANALEALNAMLARWEANGIALGFAALAEAGDDLRVPTEAQEAVVFNLAKTIAPEFGRSLSPEALEKATSGYQALSNDAIRVGSSSLDLPTSESTSGFDYRTGD
jgi:hypothetical protein